MISIITAVHNQLGMNKLFVEYLRKYTKGSYELIVIDNCSTDGTRTFFEQEADVLIKNSQNYSYPFTQNQGIERASYDYYAFLNNDLLVGPNWDERILEVALSAKLDLLSFATNERMEQVLLQKKINRRWKRFKYPLLKIGGTSERNLRLMMNLTYPRWEQFCNDRWHKMGTQTLEGFSGSCIFMTKRGLEKVGTWDERIYSADFDLYYRSLARNQSHQDVNILSTALGVYFHHFQRLTLKSKHAPFADAEHLIELESKWPNEHFSNDIEL